MTERKRQREREEGFSSIGSLSKCAEDRFKKAKSLVFYKRWHGPNQYDHLLLGNGLAVQQLRPEIPFSKFTQSWAYDK